MSKKAEATRLLILQSAFGLIYTKGYQATSIDDIIATTQVTKGAFFYHFKTKDEMGLAMIDEIMYPGMYKALVEPLTDGADPVNELFGMMKDLLLTNPLFNAKYGCPAINLIDEMAPINTGFNKALARLVSQWQTAIETCLKKARTNGAIRKDVDIKQTTWFIMTGYSGIRNLGKLLGEQCYGDYLKSLKQYLKSLQ